MLMPYTFENDAESPAEIYCRINHIDVPKMRTFNDLCRYVSHDVRYRVERSFNQMDKGLRQVLLTWAEVDNSDIAFRFARGDKLAHYTERGKRKIARTLRLIRAISAEFPNGVTEQEFLRIEQEGAE